MLKPLRKIWRLIGLLFPVLYFFYTKEPILIFIGVVLIIFVILEALRFSMPKLNEKIFKKLNFIMKEKEHKKVSTTTLFLIATFFTIFLFQKELAILALFFLVFGDSTAEIVGIKWGKKKILGKKTWEGSMACLVICIIIGVIFHYKISIGLLPVILGAIAATITELIPIRIDDNLTIPLVSGFVMMLASI